MPSVRSTRRVRVLVTTLAPLIAVWLAGSRSASAQVPPSYDVLYLGPAQSITALSETGLVAGQRTVGSATRAWVAGAGLRQTLLPLGPGDQSSWVVDVNEAGTLVGSVSVQTSPEFGGRAVAWEPDGGGGYALVELGALPGHEGSHATAVNNLGDIVGYSRSGMFRYAVWFNSPGGVMDLNPFGVFDPQSLNDARQFCDRTGRRMDLDTLAVETLTLPAGPPNYQAALGYSISESGQVAGTLVLATSTSCVYQAARWVDGEGWSTLTSCGPLANASVINGRGDVVYQALTIVQLLHLEGLGEYVLQDLLAPSASGWSVVGSFHQEINGARQVAAIATNAGTGASGAVLLTPQGVCQTDLGFGGPGVSHLSVCGDPLAGGGSAELALYGLPAHGVAFLVAGLQATPTAFKGGTLVPLPFLLLQVVAAGPAGSLALGGVPGGGGPLSVYLQALHPDASLPLGYGFSNAVRIDLLP